MAMMVIRHLHVPVDGGRWWSGVVNGDFSQTPVNACPCCAMRQCVLMRLLVQPIINGLCRSGMDVVYG